MGEDITARNLLLLPILMVVLLSLGACETNPRVEVVTEYVEVTTPVYQVPPPLLNLKLLPRPVPAYTELEYSDKSDPDKVLKAAIKSILQLETHIEEMERRELVIFKALTETQTQ